MYMSPKTISMLTALEADLATALAGAGNLFTTKGDLGIGTGSGTGARLGVGTNGQVLTARSSATTGVDWETPSSGSGNLGIFNVLDPAYGAKGDGITLYAGAISSSSNPTHFSDATASFVAGDVGKTIIIESAGASGKVPLQTTISSVTDGTHVVVADAAGTTASAVTWTYGTDDTAAIQACLTAAAVAGALGGGSTTCVSSGQMNLTSTVIAGSRACVVIPGPNKYILSYSQFDPTLGARFSRALYLPSNIDVVGVGRPWLYANQVGQHVSGQVARSIISNMDPSHNPTQSGDNHNITNNSSVTGLLLDGGFRPNQDSAGVAFPDATEDFFGFNLAFAFNIQIIGNYVIGIWGDGIRFGDNVAYDVIVERNYTTLFNGQGIANSAGQRVLIKGNICRDNEAGAGGSSEAIACDWPLDTLVEGNICDNAGTIGMFNPSVSARNVIRGNTVMPRGGASAGIEMFTNDCLCEGNSIDMSLYGADLAASARGIYVNETGTNNTIVGNMVKLTGGASLGSNVAGISGGDLISSNRIIAATPTTTFAGNAYDIIANNNSIVIGNTCAATLQSIFFAGGSGTGQVRDNVCSGTLTIGQQDHPGQILVSGNRCAAGEDGGGVVRWPLLVNSSGHIFDNNVIDAALTTNLKPAINFQFVTGPCYFRNNVINGASGVNIQNNAGSGDVFDNNIILGGGVMNLQAGQIFKRSSGGLNTLTYGTTVAIDASLGEFFQLTVTNGTGFTISNPTNSVPGMKITLTIINASGGVLGTITPGSAVKPVGGAFPTIANGKRQSVTLEDDGTNWTEVGRTSGDI